MHDTHCHIDLYPDPLIVSNETEQAKISTIAVTNLPSSYFAAKPHMSRFKYLRLAVGLHPLCANDHTKRERNLFKRAFSETKYIGEIGLDFSRHGIITKEEQLKSFQFVLDLLQHDMRFVTLHSRQAEKDVVSLLNVYKVRPVVFHWFSGSAKIMQQAVEDGHYFSVNSAMIASERGKRLVNKIPKNRLLAETDGPFIKNANNQPVKPSNVSAVYSYFASTWQQPIKLVQGTFYQNFVNVLKQCNVHSSQVNS